MITSKMILGAYKVDKEREVSGKSAKVRKLKREMRESLEDKNLWIPKRKAKNDPSYSSEEIYKRLQKGVKETITEMFPDYPEMGFYINPEVTFDHLFTILFSDGLIWKLTNIYDFDVLRHVIAAFAEIIGVAYSDICAILLDRKYTQRYNNFLDSMRV